VEEVDEEGLSGFLQSNNGLALPAAGAVLVGDGLGNLADLEGGCQKGQTTGERGRRVVQEMGKEQC
jgi:hypothetical protein